MRSVTAPVYLFACLLLGGSAQGIWQNALLQIAGVIIIAWAALAPAEEPLPRAARTLFALAAAGLGYVALQQFPLPPSLWSHGYRARLAADYQLLDLAVTWHPLSVTPFSSLSAVLAMIPPIALFCAMLRLGPTRPAWLALALVGGSLSGILLGILQVGTGPRSPWYLYEETNFGSAVGFFANANHMATLLLVTLPFVAALVASNRGRDKQRMSALLLIGAVLALLLLVGIALNGSLAGYALAIPVLAGSALILLVSRGRLTRLIAVVAGLAAIAAVVALTSTSIGSRSTQDASTSVQSREVILKTTAEAIGDTLPFGSGLGSFLRVYRTYEDPNTVTSEYVVHAHNDYAELVLELGVPGLLLMMLFLLWFGRAVWATWGRGEGGAFTRAASVAAMAVLLHSVVDFPLRTAAISACLAMCLALLADRRREPTREADDLRPTRHLVFE